MNRFKTFHLTNNICIFFFVCGKKTIFFMNHFPRYIDNYKYIYDICIAEYVENNLLISVLKVHCITEDLMVS